MSKFNKATSVLSRAVSPIRSVGTAPTAQGSAGVTRDAKSELFLLAVANMVGEDTFYEAAGARDERFRDLVHTMALDDFDWLTRFAGWLRQEANMRSASVVAAVEAVWGRRHVGIDGGHRQLIDAVCRRADEPGEVLAYSSWAPARRRRRL